MSSRRIRAPQAAWAGLILLFSSLGACQSKSSAAGAGAAGVGDVDFTFSTGALSHEVSAHAWYPALASPHSTRFYTRLYWGHSVNEAPLNDPKGFKLPLVVLAHGWHGSRFDLSWLGESLAKAGFVAVSLDFPSSDAKTYEDAQAPKVWYRAFMMRELLRAVNGAPIVMGKVDTDDIAVVGHSAGGSAAMMLAGAQIDAKRFAEHYPQAAPSVDGPWSEPHLKAVIALNPGTGPAFAPAGIALDTLPTLIISGTGDTVAPEDQNAGLYANNSPDSRWRRLVDVGHYTFLPVCSPYQYLRKTMTCGEEHTNVNRLEVHHMVSQEIVHFLDDIMPSPLFGKSVVAHLDASKQLKSASKI